MANTDDRNIYEYDITINKLGYYNQPTEFSNDTLLSSEYINDQIITKIAALENENATLKEQIQNLYNLYEQIRG